MITPKIEELLWNGSAKYESFTLGGSGTLTINQQPGSFIIITDFKYFPFFNRKANGSFPVSISDVSQFVAHTIRFKSNNLYYYNFRHNINRVNDSNSNDHYWLPVDTPTDTNCYQVHRSTIQIDIWRLVGPNLWTSFSLDPVPPKSNELPPGNGYLGLTQVSKIESQPGVNYVPLTSERSQYTNEPGYREQYYNDTNSASLSFTAGNQVQKDSIYQLPLINVNCVRVNENINEKLF